MSRSALRAAWTARDPALAARLGTWFAIGGAAFNLLALVVPHAPAGGGVGKALTAVVGVVLSLSGLVGLLRPNLVPPVLWAASPAYGAVVITVTNVVTSDTSTAAEVFFLWPVLIAAHLLPPRTAAFVLGLSLLGEVATVLQGPDLQMAIYNAVALVLTLSTMAAVVMTLRARVDRLVGRLAEQALQDALTQLPNRRAFDEQLRREFATAQRSGNPVSLLSIDLDNLKTINDQQGHSAGDAALRRLAAELTAAVRQGDFVGRLGGDEFVALLPGCSSDDAVGRAEELRAQLRAADVPPLTVSIGIATYPGSATTEEALLACADAALYDAKRAGRDRSALGACAA